MKMDNVFIASVDDDMKKLSDDLDICIKNSESILILKEKFSVFKEKYPDKWKEIKEDIANEILGYFEI